MQSLIPADMVVYMYEMVILLSFGSFFFFGKHLVGIFFGLRAKLYLFM